MVRLELLPAAETAEELLVLAATTTAEQAPGLAAPSAAA
jgi:hypothetical protein